MELGSGVLVAELCFQLIKNDTLRAKRWQRLDGLDLFRRECNAQPRHYLIEATRNDTNAPMLILGKYRIVERIVDNLFELVYSYITHVV
jgi:hypothetical protein